jgi:hypothetical protein
LAEEVSVDVRMSVWYPITASTSAVERTIPMRGKTYFDREIVFFCVLGGHRVLDEQQLVIALVGVAGGRLDATLVEMPPRTRRAMFGRRNCRSRSVP